MPADCMSAFSTFNLRKPAVITSSIAAHLAFAKKMKTPLAVNRGA